MRRDDLGDWERRAGWSAVLAEAYRAGDSIRTIARNNGVSYGTARNLLAEAGVVFRPRGGDNRNRDQEEER